MVTPNMPSSAQNIINNFLSGGYSTAAQDNPYRVEVDPFRPPVENEDDKLPTDPCPEGFVYDPVMKRCMPIEEAQESDDDDKDPFDPTKALLDRMKKDPTTGFGASNILDDYVTEGLGQGTFLKFDPSVGKPPPFFGLGILDAVLGGNERRQNLYNDAIKFMQENQYGQNVGNDLFQIFTPEQYYRNVSGNLLDPNATMTPSGENITVGQAVESVLDPKPQSGESSGSPIAQDLSGGLLYTSPLTSVKSDGTRVRNDAAYRAAVARNIERNKKDFGTSKFKVGLGFTGGR
jgi:hypothetical protein